MTTGAVIEVKTPSGKSLFVSIAPVQKRVSYSSTRIWSKETIDMLSGSSWTKNPSYILVEDEAAVTNSSFPLAFLSPILVIQYAPNRSRRLTASAFADLIKKLLGSPDLEAAKKGKLLPAVGKIIEDHGLVFDHYMRRSFTFRRIPILVLIDKADDPWRRSEQ